MCASDRVHVTLSPNGRIFMNRKAHALLGKPSAVYLYYSRADDQIGMEPSSPRLPESMPVLETKQGWRVNAAPFCRNFGIKLDTTEKFIRPEHSNDGLILKLSETVTVSSPRKRKRR